MKIGPLPKDLDLRSLAARGVVIKGTASLDALPRLSESEIGLEAPVVAELQFRRDEEGRYVEATLTLTCQRCLDGMSLTLVAGSTTACVWNDSDAAALPSGLEPLVVGETADLNEIVEEELLLAVPVSPVHEKDCLIDRGGEESAKASVLSPDPGRTNPFSVLKDLRT
jgi:uncharacterized protein